jgi:hypothetical protein
LITIQARHWFSRLLRDFNKRIFDRIYRISRIKNQPGFVLPVSKNPVNLVNPRIKYGAGPVSKLGS